MYLEGSRITKATVATKKAVGDKWEVTYYAVCKWITVPNLSLANADAMIESLKDSWDTKNQRYTGVSK